MSAEPAPGPPPATATPAFLFLAFSQLALSGFGGVMPFAYHHIVERRRWHTSAEFAEMLALGQVLPGPTICNVAVMIGWRQCGTIGAVAALAGMLAGPAVAVVLLGALYAHFAGLAQVRHALTGMSAVAAGLIMAMAVKMAMGLFREQGSRRRATIALDAALAVLAFVAVGLAHRPLILVVGVLGPLAVALARWSRA